jgi:hypothetical protein
MHLVLKRGTKYFHETKIPTVDRKVQRYSNFSQKNGKKMKSPSSMKNGRFHPPKYRVKVL